MNWIKLELYQMSHLIYLSQFHYREVRIHASSFMPEQWRVLTTEDWNILLTGEL